MSGPTTRPENGFQSKVGDPPPHRGPRPPLVAGLRRPRGSSRAAHTPPPRRTLSPPVTHSFRDAKRGPVVLNAGEKPRSGARPGLSGRLPRRWVNAGLATSGPAAASTASLRSRAGDRPPLAPPPWAALPRRGGGLLRRRRLSGGATVSKEWYQRRVSLFGVSGEGGTPRRGRRPLPRPPPSPPPSPPLSGEGFVREAPPTRAESRKPGACGRGPQAWARQAPGEKGEEAGRVCSLFQRLSLTRPPDVGPGPRDRRRRGRGPVEARPARLPPSAAAASGVAAGLVVSAAAAADPPGSPTSSSALPAGSGHLSLVLAAGSASPKRRGPGLGLGGPGRRAGRRLRGLLTPAPSRFTKSLWGPAADAFGDSPPPLGVAAPPPPRRTGVGRGDGEHGGIFIEPGRPRSSSAVTGGSPRPLRTARSRPPSAASPLLLLLLLLPLKADARRSVPSDPRGAGRADAGRGARTWRESRRPGSARRGGARGAAAAAPNRLISARPPARVARPASVVAATRPSSGRSHASPGPGEGLPSTAGCIYCRRRSATTS